MGFFSKLFGRQSKTPATQEEFADLYAEAMGRLGLKGALRYEPENFSFHVDRGEEGSLFISLGNAYTEYCRAADEDKEETLMRYVAISLASPQSTDRSLAEVAAHLVPLVRHRSTLSVALLSLRIRSGELKTEIPIRVVSDHLSVALAIDSEQAIEQVNASQLEDWGLSFDDALALASDNLRRASHGHWEQIGPGVYRSPWRDSYDGCRIACPDLIEQLHVEGDPVVMLPNRICTLVTGSRSKAGLLTMLEAAEAAQQEDRPTSMVPIVYRDGAWSTFRAEEAFPELTRFRSLRLLELFEDYATQKELLDTLHEKEEVDIFVATCMAMQNKETQEVSTTISTWSEDVQTLLPISEEIAFVRMDGSDPITAPWEKVMEVAGALLVKTDHYPPRYETLGFPTPEMFSRLTDR